MMQGFIRDSRRTLGHVTIGEPESEIQSKNKGTGNAQTSSQVHFIVGEQSSWIIAEVYLIFIYCIWKFDAWFLTWVLDYPAWFLWVFNLIE